MRAPERRVFCMSVTDFIQRFILLSVGGDKNSAFKRLNEVNIVDKVFDCAEDATALEAWAADACAADA
jgi:hypothetical protein